MSCFTSSYDDKNYLITVEEEHSNPHIKELWPHGYVLKVLNSMDSPKKHVGEAHSSSPIEISPLNQF